MTDTVYLALHRKGANDTLTVDELACALYEGTAHVRNLAEKLARIYGRADALTFYDMASDDVQNFWRGIALQLIQHSSHWTGNRGSACCLDEAEAARLAALPRVDLATWQNAHGQPADREARKEDEDNEQ